jgi:uncharacterized protein with PIN domain
MHEVTFRFHGDLSDFLPPALRGQAIPYPLDGTVAVKHPIEALGVPHPEVAAITANGRSVDFTYWLLPGDVVEVYGQDAVLPDGAIALRPPLPRPVRFVLDTHLGRLATYLRILGCDTLYSNAADDEELARIAHAEARVLLTRDLGLLKRKAVIYGHWVRAFRPRDQLVAVVRRYDLWGELQPWRRCPHCNGSLAPVDKAEILERLEPKTRLYYDEFLRCAACGQVYWQGSHHARLQAFIDGVLAES